MLNRKLLLLIILLIGLVSISAASAADDAGSNIVNADVSDNINFDENDNIPLDVLGSSGKELDSNSEGEGEEPPGNGELGLRELNDKINGNSDDTVYLDDNYKFYDVSDKNFRNGIKITRAVTIEGNGHTIDGLNEVPIFKVENSGVVFKNIIFTNCKSNGEGSAISGECNAIKCKFISNQGSKGGAIASVNATDCDFSDNLGHYGGAMHEGTAIDCRFSNNQASNGGAIYNVHAINCTFTGNTGITDEAYGGAMYGGDALGCTFTENTVNEGFGGAIYKGSATECDFSKNTAKAGDTGTDIGYGGAICQGDAVNCTFSENSACSGGAIYQGSATDCNFTQNTVEGNSDLQDRNGGAICQGNAINCIFTQNNASGSGGAIYVGNATGCNFTQNAAVYGHGGAIYEGNATGCTFTQNTAVNYGDGGAICIGDASDCNFTQNTGGRGGAICMGNAINCNFTNCSSTNNAGGAICMGNASNCNFTQNTAATDGGAISLGNATDCDFTLNSASGGGAIENGTAINCTFTQNTASAGAGAILGGSAIDCNFTQNSASYSGAIYNVDAANCIFIGNNASSEGGAMNGGSAIDCRFINNTAANGGAINDADATNCLFNHNVATDSQGGAMRRGNAINCTFIENLVENGEGGAIFMGNATDCNFTGNQGTIGGAMYGETAINCNFINNWAFNTDDERGGGAIYDGTAINCSFLNNTAINGGAMYEATAINCTFTNNSASNEVQLPEGGYGGAIYQGEATNCIFKDNVADTSAGAIYRGSEALCIFENNDCDGILYITPKLIASNFSSAYNSGEKLLFNLTADDTNYDGYNTTISIYNNEELVGTYYALSGEDGGWIVNLTLGNYNATLSLEDHAEVEPVNVTILIYALTAVSAENVTTTYNNESFLVINLTDHLNETLSGFNLNVDLNGENNYTTDENGQVMISTKGLAADTYTATIVFEGDELYIGSNTTAQVTINKEPTRLNASDITTNYNVNEDLIITLTDDLGNALGGFDVAVDLNGVENYTTDENGQIIISTNGLAANDYNVDIAFAGDENYTESNAAVQVTINKAVTSITASDVSTSYNVNEDLVITLTDDLGNALGGFDVAVDLNGVENYTTDENGQIKVATAGLVPNKYPAIIIFAGNENYTESNTSAQVTITKSTPDIYVTANDIVYGDEAVIEFTLTDAGNAKLNGTLLVIVGVESFNVTVANGTGSIAIDDLRANTYTVVANYYGDSNYDHSFGIGILNVARKASVIVYADMNTTAVQTGVDGRVGEYFNVTLVDADGNPLAGKAIQIGFNGKVYNRTTNETGGACLQINLPREDIYTFAICFLGDENYTGSFEVAKITVNKQTAKLTVPNKSYRASANSKTLTATFKSAKGNALAKKKISFTVNGKTYTATTNSNGVATVKVSLNKKGTYSVTAKYAGDSTYAAISKKAILKLT